MKEKIIAFRVTDEEKKKMEQRAKEKKMTLSQLFVYLFYRYSENI